jgi:hypothetical protein
MIGRIRNPRKISRRLFLPEELRTVVVDAILAAGVIGPWGGASMTEPEWLAAIYPCRMLDFFKGKLSERKLRLYAVACCRRVWPLLQMEAARRIVGLAEAYADGEADGAELRTAHDSSDFAELPARSNGETEAGPHLSVRAVEAIQSARALATSPFHIWDAVAIADATSLEPTGDFFFDPKRHNGGAGVPPDDAEAAEQAKILRELIGNPFRQVRIPSVCLTPTVATLAQATYDERTLPTGELNTGRLAVLSDALEEAGCTDAEILTHLRSPGPHVRGCWALDLILGKE